MAGSQTDITRGKAADRDRFLDPKLAVDAKRAVVVVVACQIAGTGAIHVATQIGGIEFVVRGIV